MTAAPQVCCDCEGGWNVPTAVDGGQQKPRIAHASVSRPWRFFVTVNCAPLPQPQHPC